jgi:hypothetical protein
MKALFLYFKLFPSVMLDSLSCSFPFISYLINSAAEAVSDCWLTLIQPLMSWREQVNCQWDDDEVRFVLNQHSQFGFLSFEVIEIV